MATLVWDKVGERVYQTGVDRGVLYLSDGTTVVWNGLISVEESSDSELKSYYLDGVKFLENLSPGEFSAKLSAYTYPDEFESVNGVATVAPGLNYYEQPPKSFCLSYRTKIGNDTRDAEYGYKIHILYNILAKPEAFAYESVSESTVTPIAFAWSLSGTPPKVPNNKYRPSVHVSFDSTKTPAEILQMVERILYGTETANASVPSISDINELFGYLGALIIIDYGDGTWAAMDESDNYITMLDETTFQIVNANARMLDADTYEISSTNAD